MKTNQLIFIIFLSSICNLSYAKNDSVDNCEKQWNAVSNDMIKSINNIRVKKEKELNKIFKEKINKLTDGEKEFKQSYYTRVLNLVASQHEQLINYISNIPKEYRMSASDSSIPKKCEASEYDKQRIIDEMSGFWDNCIDFIKSM